MATLVVTGTADQLHRFALMVQQAVNAAPDSRAVAATIDNAPAGSIASVSVPGDPKSPRLV